MEIITDPLTAWLLTYEDGIIRFVHKASQGVDNLSEEIKTRILERVKLQPGETSGKIPNRPFVVESDDFSREKWLSIKDKMGESSEAYQANKSLIPLESILYASFDVEMLSSETCGITHNLRVSSNISIGNSDVLLFKNNLACRDMVPQSLGDSLVGKEVSQICDHEAFKNQAIIVENYESQGFKLFLVKRSQIKFTI
jgi:hypothetical protein